MHVFCNGQKDRLLVAASKSSVLNSPGNKNNIYIAGRLSCLFGAVYAKISCLINSTKGTNDVLQGVSGGAGLGVGA